MRFFQRGVKLLDKLHPSATFCAVISKATGPDFMPFRSRGDTQIPWPNEKIILSRANSLVEACFPACEYLWLATPDYGPSDVYASDLPAKLDMKRALEWVDESEAPEDQVQVAFFVKRVRLRPRSLDWMFTRVAEEGAKVVLFDEAQRTCLAPYDLGFDVICLQHEKIVVLERDFRSWMSDRPDKL